MSTLVYKREPPSLTSLFLSVSGPSLFSPRGGWKIGWWQSAAGACIWPRFHLTREIPHFHHSLYFSHLRHTLWKIYYFIPKRPHLRFRPCPMPTPKTAGCGNWHHSAEGRPNLTKYQLKSCGIVMILGNKIFQCRTSGQVHQQCINPDSPE